MRIFILTLILFLSAHTIYSQKLCGVKLTPEQVELERAKTPLVLSRTAAPQCCLGKILSMTFWVVKDSSGDPGVSDAAIFQAVADLNPYFEPICLSFSVCSIKYIDDWNYDSLFFPDENDQLYTLYQIPNTINIYLSAIIATDPFTTVAGMGALPGGADAIWLTKGSLTGGKTFPHEMGHFLGLYHTFETDFGLELANGSNCASTGDLVCDTPADPGGTNGADCQLNPYTQDANGDWYVPHIGNIMSYYDDACACGFTTQQYDRMCQQYLTERFNLW